MMNMREAITSKAPVHASRGVADPPSGASVRLEELVKRYGDVAAVDGISLEIKSGELLTLLGPSGSGKTTTLSMIGGFRSPTSGRIYVSDLDVSGLPAYKRNIGVVFQEYALFPHMNVFKNVAFPLKMRRVHSSEITARVSEMLETVHLTGYEDRFPRQLSGGQQQRVALARALVFRPSVLLMDEPLGSLDRRLRDEMQFELRRLHEEMAVTIITVTHDQEEALTMSDRIAVMNDGVFEQVGDPVDIYHRPKNVFVADFLGDSNFFYGHVAKIEAGIFDVRDDNGILIGGLSGHDCREGDRVVLMVRPERLAFLSEADLAYNSFDGLVKQAVFLGDSFRYQIEIHGGLLVTMKRPAWDRLQPRRGERVRVGWRSVDCVTYSEPRTTARPGAGITSQASDQQDGEEEVTVG